MTSKQTLIALFTIVRKEVGRFFRIWTQTLLPSVSTSILYYLIFGAFIGSQIQEVREGVSYIQFIVPGLVMMGVINNSFANVVGSFFGSKFMRSIEEMLVAPMPPWVIIAGFAAGGVLRGIIVGFLTLLVALFFTQIHIVSIPIIFLSAFLTATLFSLGGLLNGLFAKNFDQTAIIPTFILAPLIYLGGVFYSIDVLPPFWQMVSRLNPILYMVNAFRYGFLGFSDVSVGVSMVILVLCNAIFLVTALYFFRRGYGLKS